jgi:hypothetical protein
MDASCAVLTNTCTRGLPKEKEKDERKASKFLSQKKLGKEETMKVGGRACL